jgi:hypothetical protein
MSLSELVGELKGRPEKKKDIAEVELEAKLEGQVTETGDIRLDTTDLDAIGAKLKEVRAKQRTLKKEEDALKALILSHKNAKAGYANQSIEIEGTESIDLQHPPLLAALMKTKTFGAACNLSLSQPKVREIAAKNKDVAAAIKMQHGRKIKTTR